MFPSRVAPRKITYLDFRPAKRLAQLFSKRKLLHVAHVMGPTFVALTFAGVAHAQGTMDFSGAQTLMGTFKTFAIYAGAVTRVVSGFDLPRQAKYANSATEIFATDRIQFLERTAAFRRIDLHW